jgi:tRNA A37 methylthiotransferase MiaB
MSTIPRLSLSDGCLYNCKFCCVEKTIKEYSRSRIIQQCGEMGNLDFELVYLNDKTFGQAKNHKLLPELLELLAFVNPNFKGFIIQTTATNFLRLSNEVLACVAYVELGIESFNDSILKAMNKPHKETIIQAACDKIRNIQAQGQNIKLIPNILVSLPGETTVTYQKTLDFLKENSNIISHINVYSLAIYDNTKLNAELPHTESDKNENNIDKSWSNTELDNWFMEGIKNA